MNVASQELSKELYELSGWKTNYCYFEQANQPGLAEQKPSFFKVVADSKSAVGEYPYFEGEICGGYFDDSETYEYRGVMACEEHFDELCQKRDAQRQQVIETTQASVRSQADGEWHNGGYKTMKTDNGGRPITKVREPQTLKDYEDGLL